MKSYILLDRSGSMMSNWTETIGALNGFAHQLAKDAKKAKVTVCAFDNQGFDVVRENGAVKEWEDISPSEISPRGMTPLFDAIGRIDQMVKGKRASVLIMTDGAENASKEMSKDG